MKRWQIFFLLFLVAGTFIILSKNVPYRKEEGRIFGTTYHITYKSKNDLKEDIAATLKMVDNSLSPFNSNSIISKINNNEPAVLDSMFMYVFNMAQNVSQATDGAFDITVAPLVNAWGFGFKQGITPDSCTIDSLRRYIGYEKITLKDGTIAKEHPETMLNCSAIAKGYGCDAIASMFQSKGIEDYMIEIGGEISMKGKNDKGNAWSIGINTPNEGNSNELQTILQLTDRCLATSGNYRNFRYVNNKKVSHTIDPKTGYPANHSLLSVTIIANECAYADAIATACMVMGLDKSFTFCKTTPGIEAYFIYADEQGKMNTFATEGFNRYIRK